MLATGEASDSQQSLEGGTINISLTVSSSVAVVNEKANRAAAHGSSEVALGLLIMRKT